ncbi:Asp-tRNA(Asn)/Glu-tRNA(Gln) amidotransferase subunit GatC [Halothermothrix orenii]|uniref:Aspartyl/glutamyl-tRNA(Asn/Gln) amidotransferase subunit C n=1 Tax=Halothermothrix orenii (strain H 168 / OCM 544 / DSM 9562) TaxID=373903 RepID=GATC_HALOH|nr:Asp-tRNA(Asn)/Glu-tRNA(Gln) amidotransferase subunit GatC [Halothermothrix orenii]B8D124.1 RecName: Full=Aspartyl/glutamyl-tRNA(Asn/Gln) amidotransferase subunit C; Short=Asp/Glu-ADT subunit C [Halothermothrix orenii H 168]ACL68993.1 glutamyl-tRNA(Gln) amidotransferase, C subunit [Halothermothrix orenii H 168]
MIKKEEVEKIAGLAYLKLSDEERETFTRQLGDILDYVEKLNELDTDGVVPTAYTVPMKNVLRDDKVGSSIPREEALDNAPDKKDGLFRVPSIIGE